MTKRTQADIQSSKKRIGNFKDMCLKSGVSEKNPYRKPRGKQKAVKTEEREVS